jgi:hypothetical protein
MSSSAASTSSQSVSCIEWGGRFHPNQFKTTFYPPAIMECRLCLLALIKDDVTVILLFGVSFMATFYSSCSKINSAQILARYSMHSECRLQTETVFLNFLKELRIQFQGIDSASLCSLASRYDNPIPTRFLEPIYCYKIPALDANISIAKI